MMTKFTKLRTARIVGYIDSLDVCHSVQQNLGEGVLTHEDIWGAVAYKRWTWTYQGCIDYCLYQDRFEAADYDIITNHLERKYGIRFYRNGYHDVEYFGRMLQAEK